MVKIYRIDLCNQNLPELEKECPVMVFTLYTGRDKISHISSSNATAFAIARSISARLKAILNSTEYE